MSARTCIGTKSPRRSPRRAAGRGAEGFTLIEVIIALGVFLIGALTLSLVMPLATRRIVAAANQTRASELAAQRAEQILVTPWGDGDLTVGTHNDEANPHDQHYYVSWSVLDSVPVPNCKRITVNVSRTSVSATPVAQTVVVVPMAGASSP
jgi:prepilin-type N-terminal cleavage/methylation domain-containing protein